MNAWHLITWEAHLSSGEVQRERDGVKYSEINRPLLTNFLLVAPGEVLVNIPVPSGASGFNLCYRRRTLSTQGVGARYTFLMGWVPMGPMLLVDPATDSVRQEEGFIAGDPEMDPPAMRPHEGEDWEGGIKVVRHKVNAQLAEGVDLSNALDLRGPTIPQEKRSEILRTLGHRQ